MDFFVIAKVGTENYFTKVVANSCYSAEHKILDLGICGLHTYGVDGCMAYDDSMLHSDSFVSDILNSQPISFDNLIEVIKVRNDEIRRSDEKEKRIEELESQINSLQAELRNLKKG